MEKFTINQTDPEVFNQEFNKAIKNRSLGKITQTHYDPKNHSFKLTITKLGTSTITFNISKDSNNKIIFTKKDEKLALAHRPFKVEMSAKLTNILEKLGASAH